MAAATSNWKEYGKYIGIAVAAGFIVWAGMALFGRGSAPAPASDPAPIAAAPAPEPQVPMQPACLPGYVFYPDKGVCAKTYEKPVEAVRDAGCKPGDKREVPDPANPGHTLYQVCGYSSGG